MLFLTRLPDDVDDLLPEARPGARQGLAASVGRAVVDASGPRSTPRGCVPFLAVGAAFALPAVPPCYGLSLPLSRDGRDPHGCKHIKCLVVVGLLDGPRPRPMPTGHVPDEFDTS